MQISHPTIRGDLRTAIVLLMCASACAGPAASAPTPSSGHAVSTSGTPSEVPPATPATPAPTRTARPRPTPTPRPAAVVGVLDATGAGWGMAMTDGTLWIQVDPPVDAIVKIDIETGVAEPAIPQGFEAKAGPDGLWAACCDGIARIDPETNEHLVEVVMDGAFTVGDAGVWILSESDGLQQVDSLSGALSDSVAPFDGSVCIEGWKDLVVAFDSGWLACKEGKVVRIDTATAETNVLLTGPGAHTFALTEDAVWVTNYQSGGSVSRIDPATNEVLTTPGAGAGIGITYGDGFIWASTGTGIAQIDPATAVIVREFPIGRGWFYELIWDDGFIWVSTTSREVLKVDPYR